MSNGDAGHRRHPRLGGQILRTALTLSIGLDKTFRLFNIRACRRRPGLQYQHLTAVKAAADISQAEVYRATRDSQLLEFHSRRIVAGDYQFDIGTAGSTSLVLETVLPALMLAPSPSTVTLRGGTHNPLATPFEFVQYALLPLINKVGAHDVSDSGNTLCSWPCLRNSTA